MRTIWTAIFIGGIFASCTIDYARYADPMAGTDRFGHCHPAACVPLGNIQVGPQTGHCGWDYSGGYLSEDTLIEGFYHTAVNGTGVPDLGDLLFFPSCRETEGTRSTYDKTSERATPGCYEVYLKDAGVLARMSATAHSALHQYTFDDPSGASLLIDFQNNLVKEPWLEATHIKASEQSLEDARHLSGWARSNIWVDRNYYYSVEFDHSVIACDTLPLRHPEEKAPRWRLRFDMSDGKPLMVKVSISAKSMDGARRNLACEIPSWGLRRVEKQARRAWNHCLGKIRISESPRADSLFYTAMYHLFTQPNNIADHGDPPLYSTLSIWDTYRAVHPLYTLIAPEIVDDLVNSMLSIYDRQGYLPIWNLWGEDNLCMVGNHSVPVIVDAYLKGFRGFDPERAWEAIRTTLTTPHWKSDWGVYDKYGYFPYDIVPKQSVSTALECTYDDWCAAQMARALGHDADTAYFLRRAAYWKNLLDPQTHLMRARDHNGAWRMPFRPLRISHEAGVGGDYVEGNAWQYTWHVQHDIPGLIAALGGEETFCAQLDSLFALTPGEGEGELAGVFGGQIGQYLHGNEPSHHIAYLYALAGQPEKTRRLIPEICRTQYRTGVHAFSGNEDCGQMSAWYIFSALGFYPVNPCGGTYVLGIPQVRKASVRLGRGRKLMVATEGTGMHVSKITWNGKEVTDVSVRHEDLSAGGMLKFYLE